MIVDGALPSPANKTSSPEEVRLAGWKKIVSTNLWEGCLWPPQSQHHGGWKKEVS